MDRVKGVAKSGWHSGKEKAGGISSRGSGGSSSGGGGGGIRDRASGMLHRGKDPYEERRANHQSAPLSSLRDPDSFGPPPKHSAYYGSESPTGFQSSGGGGLGSKVPAPLPRKTQEEIEAEEEAARVPSGPYQRDTTGLRTDNLPKPPVRRNNDSPVSASPSRSSTAPPPPPRSTASPALSSATPPPPPRNTASPASRAVPAPPPRLPPRQNEYPDENSPMPPPTYNEALGSQQSEEPAYINQGAANRLGQAGVSVPGFGIGAGNVDSNATPPESPQPSAHTGQLNELQSRFARMNTSNSSNSNNAQQQQASPTAQSTTWQQKQEALRTAQNFQNNPSQVSLSDARNAASTAHSFQQRHGSQVASAAQTAGNLNTKFGVSQKLGGLGMGQQQAPAKQGYYESPPQTPTSPADMAAAAHKKKPPPPPPAKKPTLSGINGGGSGVPSPTTDGSAPGGVPPPVPLMSRPKPS